MTSRIILAFCVLLVAWLTAGAMAVRSASRIWLRHWAERRLHGASSVLMYLQRPQRLLAAAQTGVALTLVAAGAVIGWRSAEDQDAAVLALAGYAALIVVAGQLLPRAIARRWPSGVIPLTMPLLQVAEWLTAPLEQVASTGTRASLGTPGAPKSAAHVAMATLLREGELEGVGRSDEIAIISGVMHFGERRVRDVMTPRADIFAIAEELDPRSTALQIAESKFSRVPVHRGSLDNIAGMYHAFDVINEGPDVRPPVRPVVRAPGDTLCSELLFRMLRQRIHLAIVEDPTGKTLGIATLENLLEELVGDIHDEHDEPATAGAPKAKP
jgi:putative hemolysin